MSRRPMLFVAVVVLSVAAVTACGTERDLSVSESCKQWHQLSKGPSIMTPETNAQIDQDLKAAEPRMHESVARQVRIYIAHDRMHLTKDESDAEVAAVMRLADICGVA